MEQLTQRITDSATVSVVEVSCRGSCFTAPLLKLTERIVRSGVPPRETLGGLLQAVIHPHCFGAGGLTVNNSFTVTGRSIPSYKKRPRRETRPHRKQNHRPYSGQWLQRIQIQIKRWGVKHAPPKSKLTSIWLTSATTKADLSVFHKLDDKLSLSLVITISEKTE